MKFLHSLSTSLSALLVIGAVAAIAAPDGIIRNSVAVCNPYTPENCVQPDNTGKIPIIGDVNAVFLGAQPVITDPGPAGEASHSLISNYTLSASGSVTLTGSRANLFGFQVTSGATPGYVMVFNLGSDPADGAVTPAKCYVLAANSTLGVDFRPGPPLFFDNGITIVFSSTGCFTKTEVAEAYMSGEAN